MSGRLHKEVIFEWNLGVQWREELSTWMPDGKNRYKGTKSEHARSGAISNPELLKHGVNGGAEGGRWVKECEAQPTAISSDHLRLLPVLFISISRRWWKECRPPSQNLSLLGHLTLGKWSNGLHSLKCWFRDLANHWIKILFLSPPPHLLNQIFWRWPQYVVHFQLPVGESLS